MQGNDWTAPGQFVPHQVRGRQPLCPKSNKDSAIPYRVKREEERGREQRGLTTDLKWVRAERMCWECGGRRRRRLQVSQSPGVEGGEEKERQGFGAGETNPRRVIDRTRSFRGGEQSHADFISARTRSQVGPGPG